MGADLLISLVEIEKKKKPNFKKAGTTLQKISDKAALDALEWATGCETADPKEARARIEKALESVVAGWSGNLRQMVKVCGLATDMLIAGGVSWGDSVEECEDIALFVEAGLARAAGFLTEPVKIVKSWPRPQKPKRCQRCGRPVLNLAKHKCKG